MALGRAFIEVHADLTPFKKDLGEGVAKTIRSVQAAVDKAVREGMGEAEKRTGGGKSKVISPTIKPKLDTTDVDKDSDRVARGFRGAMQKGFKGAMEQFNSFWDSSGATRNTIMGGLVASAVLASPMIAAVISGAISAGIGLAGIGAGVALAFRDPRIKAAGAELGRNLIDGLTKASSVFIRPVKQAMEILQMGIDRFLPRLEHGFAAIAPYLTTLAVGVNEFLDALGPGLEAAFSNSGPFIQIVAEYLPVIGDAIGYMFEQLSASEGARAGLVLFFQMLADAIVYTTDILTFFSNVFYAFIAILDTIPPFLIPDSYEQDIDEMIAGMQKVPAPAAAVTGGLTNIGSSAGGAAGKARELTASLNDFFGAQLGWVDANLNFEESIDRVRDSFKENGRTIDINTEKGRANVQSVQGAIRAAIAMRDAKIKETGSVVAGNAVYATQIERLRGVLTKAGLTKTQIDKLIGAYAKIPPEVSTEVSVPGLSAALSRAQALNRELSMIQHDTLARKRSSGSGNTGGYASGGVVRQEQLAWVGEGNRPEAIIPLTNPGRAAEVMEEAGLLGMGGGTIVVQMVLDGKVIDERIVKTNQTSARRIQQQPRTFI